jgi:hypothetical protein
VTSAAHVTPTRRPAQGPHGGGHAAPAAPRLRGALRLYSRRNSGHRGRAVSKRWWVRQACDIADAGDDPQDHRTRHHGAGSGARGDSAELTGTRYSDPRPQPPRGRVPVS